jgi:hypothetical protein
VIRHALTVLFTLGAAAACGLLTAFFRHRWDEPVFRAFTVFFGVAAAIFLGVFVAEELLAVSVANGGYARWRPVVFRGGLAAALWYLVWTLRPQGRPR